jgi:hypothetical protein
MANASLEKQIQVQRLLAYLNILHSLPWTQPVYNSSRILIALAQNLYRLRSLKRVSTYGNDKIKLYFSIHFSPYHLISRPYKSRLRQISLT